MKRTPWPENNRIRVFRYYQKRNALRAEPDKTFSLSIYRCTDNGEQIYPLINPQPK
ncbi:TPA: hypothetical protein P5S08_004598 [Salmonella enterica subsp. enterica serovar Concord]|nr:hypothetical protein [Salmonella enterica subsp. enterica serovar Concord]